MSDYKECEYDKKCKSRAHSQCLNCGLLACSSDHENEDPEGCPRCKSDCWGSIGRKDVIE